MPMDLKAWIRIATSISPPILKASSLRCTLRISSCLRRVTHCRPTGNFGTSRDFSLLPTWLTRVQLGTLDLQTLEATIKAMIRLRFRILMLHTTLRMDLTRRTSLLTTERNWRIWVRSQLLSNSSSISFTWRSPQRCQERLICSFSERMKYPCGR